MTGSLYEIIALAARYLFAALMVLIVIRAWKITIVDARRSATLRRMSPETGVCGEFLVLTGSGKVREGMRFPVIREGMIGSSAKADVRLRANGVHRTHAYFELTKKGLRLRDHASARIYNAQGKSKREFLLGDGSKITIGSVEMMLILTVAVEAPAESPREGLFDIPDDSPVLAERPARPASRPPRSTPGTRPAPQTVRERTAAYAPPTHAPASPAHSPVSPTHAPASSTYSPASPTHAPASPAYSPSSSAHAPASSAYSPSSPAQPEIPISREAPAQDNVFAPRAPYTRDTEAQYSWRETVVDETTSRRTVVRESSIDDLFLEHTAPAAEESDSIPGWDDPWSDPAKKTVVTRHPVDDPFDN